MKRDLSPQERIDVVRYRIQNATSTLDEVNIVREYGLYNNAINRMYYACYYAASALLVAHSIQTKTHEGVRQQLGLHFVLPGIISPELGHFYTVLFGMRSSGDYEDFVTHTQKTVDETYPLAQEFVQTIKGLVEQWLFEQEH